MVIMVPMKSTMNEIVDHRLLVAASVSQFFHHQYLHPSIYVFVVADFAVVIVDAIDDLLIEHVFVIVIGLDLIFFIVIFVLRFNNNNK